VYFKDAWHCRLDDTV